MFYNPFKKIRQLQNDLERCETDYFEHFLVKRELAWTEHAVAEHMAERADLKDHIAYLTYAAEFYEDLADERRVLLVDLKADRDIAAEAATLGTQVVKDAMDLVDLLQTKLLALEAAGATAELDGNEVTVSIKMPEGYELVPVQPELNLESEQDVKPASTEDLILEVLTEIAMNTRAPSWQSFMDETEAYLELEADAPAPVLDRLAQLRADGLIN